MCCCGSNFWMSLVLALSLLLALALVPSYCSQPCLKSLSVSSSLGPMFLALSSNMRSLITSLATALLLLTEVTNWAISPAEILLCQVSCLYHHLSHFCTSRLNYTAVSKKCITSTLHFMLSHYVVLLHIHFDVGASLLYQKLIKNSTFKAQLNRFLCVNFNMYSKNNVIFWTDTADIQRSAVWTDIICDVCWQQITVVHVPRYFLIPYFYQNGRIMDIKKLQK